LRWIEPPPAGADGSQEGRIVPAHREVLGGHMKKFQYSRFALSAAAVVALAVELGAGHKFG
jgi:hypothetical protein